MKKYPEHSDKAVAWGRVLAFPELHIHLYLKWKAEYHYLIETARDCVRNNTKTYFDSYSHVDLLH